MVRWIQRVIDPTLDYSTCGQAVGEAAEKSLVLLSTN